MDTAPVLELTRDEILERIERGTRRRLGMSARELLCAYRHGRLDDPGAVADLLVLADLLAPDDPVLSDA
jgi:hypothetical protein